MAASGHDSLGARRELRVGDLSYDYFALERAAAQLGDIGPLPYSLKVLFENLLRHENGRSVTVDHLQALVRWLGERRSDQEIAFRPARVLMQDFTGVPAVVDLAAMRQAMLDLGGDPQRINPLSPVDLVIDHSVQVDAFGDPRAFQINVEREYERNGERYAFLRWGAAAFDNFRVVPPGTGICHQVNLEYLSQVVWSAPEGNRQLAYPDTLVGTDSHTTMVNGLAVLGWGVGGIEAEAAMLGQPISMVIPEVVGFKLTGQLPEGATATDLVLTVTEMLRKKGVVGKFVEFYGDGLDHLPLADRATIGNMSPEYGATCGIFPIDRLTLEYLRLTGRAPERIALVEAYAKAQGLWRESGAPDPVFSDTLALDLGTVEPSLAGPKRPQDRVALSRAKAAFGEALPSMLARDAAPDARVPVHGMGRALTHGDVVIAAITSCTNTSNPSVMLGAGLLARNARARGLKPAPHVKTSLAPGSKVVTDYLREAGLMDDLEALGFDLVGYGCTTCIGNSGPLPDPIAKAVDEGNLVVAAVLSGNRNFEGRIHPQVKASYLASPPLVVAYALAGSLRKDLVNEPLGQDQAGKDVYLRDIWPSPEEVADVVQSRVSARMFREAYADVFKGDELWAQIGGATGRTYAWDEASTYVRLPPYFVGMERRAGRASRHRGRAHPRPARRFHHHRPHLARGLDRQGQPGRPLPDRARRRAEGLQLLRRAARQPRGHGARHVREHPPAQRDGRRPGRRLDQADAGRSAHDHLRRRDALPGAGHAARGDRRQGVRLGLVARLGRQGRQPARREGGDRRELRAHPPLEPGRHGRPAAHVQGRPEPPVAAARRQRDDRPARRRGRHHARHGRRRHHPSRRRLEGGDHAPVPDRHARRGRLLPPRRHPALRAAPAAR